jgi:hypothetical protein
MCIFIAVAVLKGRSPGREVFGESILLDNASGTSIGLNCSLRAEGRACYVITEGGCSCALLGRGHRAGPHRDRFLQGLAKLIEQAPAVSILIHTSQGNWRAEQINLKAKKTLGLCEFKTIFPHLEEDVRYAII